MVNSQTEVLFERGRDEFVATNIRTLVPGWRFQLRAGWDEDFNPVQAHPVERGVELQAIRRNGESFAVEISFSPLQTDDGALITSAIRDIGERKKAEEQIRQLNTNLETRVLERTEELMRSNEELQQFAYIASHDLQEPLRTVSIYAQFLAKRFGSQLGADGDQFIQFIVENAERMEKLIHGLLDFSRVDARGTDFVTKMSCNAALDDAICNLRSLIDESGAVITTEPLPPVAGDPVQMTRLFQNLLVNSIKYRSEEIPRIHISVDTSGSEFLFSVQDNGIGIEPQYSEKIFGIFRSLQARDNNSGTGMGLAICRKIVSRHEGRIWVESELGKGATFYFTLPQR